MAENKFTNVQLSDHARMGYSSLGADDRRHLDVWFNKLRHWRDDEDIRAMAQRIDAEEEETYSCYTGRDLYIAFTIAADDLTVVSIFRKETLRLFKKAARTSVP